MDATSTTMTRWLVFCRSGGIGESPTEIELVCGSRRIEAIFSVERERYYNAVAEGELLGTKYIFKAASRRRLPGDERDSVVPLFAGTFDHTESVSGDFAVSPRPDGELMALGVYGAPPIFQLVKTIPNSRPYAVEAHGLPGWEVRFEDPNLYQTFASLSEIRAAGNPLFYAGYHLPRKPKDEPPLLREIRAAGNPLFYTGYCFTRATPKDALPPMPGVLVTMLLAYQLLLKPFHLDSA
jgi:hypothetical protein